MYVSVPFPLRISAFLQTSTKGKVIAYLPEKFIQFTGILLRHEIKFKAKKLEVNDLCYINFLNVTSDSGHVIPIMALGLL